MMTTGIMVVLAILAIAVAALVLVMSVRMGRKIGYNKALTEAWEKQQKEDTEKKTKEPAAMATATEAPPEEAAGKEAPKAPSKGADRKFAPHGR